MYYIFVYIQFVLLTPWLSKLAKSKYCHLGWAVAPVSMLFFYYWGLFTQTEPNVYLSIFWSDICLGWFTYYYLGLLLGNRIIKLNYSFKTLIFLYSLSIILQMAEGYGLLLLGEINCGTQVKLTSLITSTLFLFMVYSILNNPNINIKNTFLRLLGDYSFGIYLCHILVIMILRQFPYYTIIPYPLSSVIVILISLFCCCLGKKMLGEKISELLGIK